MEKDNRILIGSIVIIVLVVISFNFSITGSVVKEYSSVRIRVSPEVVNAGEVVYVDVEGGVNGVNNRADFIYAIDDLRVGSKENICGDGAKCSGVVSFSYVISPGWERGVYYVVVFDYAAGEFVQEEFTVV
ncbi:MAG: hypothetical protein ABIB47_00935 [Candidatus Woesearchaeota archaeon]